MSEFEYDRDPTMGMVSAEEFNAMAARAEKTEAALIAADKEIVELEAEAVALKADLARAVEERDAALDLLVSIHESMKRPSQARLDEAWKRIEPLLLERGLLGGER